MTRHTLERFVSTFASESHGDMTVLHVDVGVTGTCASVGLGVGVLLVAEMTDGDRLGHDGERETV